MIYVTGDIHGDIDRLTGFDGRHISGPGKEDCLIVCGDFGFLWYGDSRDSRKLEQLSGLGFTLLFADGNHENFSCLDSLPTEERFGGIVGVAAPGVYHLRRGEVYCAEGRKIFVMGGAASQDYMLRKRNVDWWERELPSTEEYARAEENLRRAGYSVDMIISHTAPSEVAALLSPEDPRETVLREFLTEVWTNTEYNSWYFGHFHRDMSFRKGLRCLYRDVVKA